MERAHAVRVLALARHDQAQAARALGLTRATLYATLREHGLDAGATAER